MHPFVNKNGNQNELYFEVANDMSLKPENDKSNRTPNHRNDAKSKEKVESRGTGGKGEKRYNNDENYLDSSGSHLSKTSRNIRAQEQAVNYEPRLSVQRMQFPHEFSTLSKEDILPQINEDEEEVNMVMVNNKKIKMKSPQSKKQAINYSTHIKTEPSHQKALRNSINLDESRLNDSFE